jgi:3-isopropylmalate/(R)-2-methylmalate dehydratase small subunit
MKPFRVERGLVAPLLRADVDTDQIIPKQFLKRIDRSGFEDALFFDWRAEPGFVLDQPRYRGASILVTGRNFGCGSSREHAAWALRDAGFRAIIAPSFADIFLTNCTNNGIAAIAVSEEIVAGAACCEELTVDLEACQLRDNAGFQAPFEMDAARRRRLLEGLDEIGLTLLHEAEIVAYESRNQ